MAKRKKKRKRLRNRKINSSLKKANQTGVSCYSEWIQSMPDWINKIQHLVGCGYTIQAKELLSEEEIQKELANIKDAKNRAFVLYEVAMLMESTGQVERAAQYYTNMLNIPETSRIKELSMLYRKAGILWAECGRCMQAVEYFTIADKLEPNNPDTLNCFAGSTMKIGRLEEAMDLLRKALTIKPQARDAYSNLLLVSNYLHSTKADEIFEESKKWAKIQAPTTLALKNHDNSLEPHRKLRIGYISPDFKDHSVTFYFESLLNGHDRNKFEIYGYGNVGKPNEGTYRLIDKFDFYRDIFKVGDEEVVELIISDSIDILVDLAGHTGKNRLHVLAYKPAPIQVTYLGYPNTTGMTQIDYRLTDDIVDTPEQQKYYTEKLVFLPNGFLCYNPGQRQPTVKSLPMLYKHYITFGSFNVVNKLSPVVMKIWVDILNAVPNSKLILKFTEGVDPKVREYYHNLFAEYGLENPEDRIMIFKWLSISEHFELYNKVDIALDTYPYNGTTTTCQAFLMGVPVITLVGPRHASRVGLDILTRLEMQFFAAQSHEEYVKKAVALAANPEALTKIRETMRNRLAASPLCNYKLITNDIENAYRKMWHDYCRSKGIEIKQITSQQDTDYKPRRYEDRTIIDDIISADEFYQAGQRLKATKHAVEAFKKLSSDNNGQKPPKQLLQRYNADDLQSLIINFCMEIVAFSSCLSHDNYYRIYVKSQEMNPSNPEIDLRIGLLMAFQARLKNEKIQDNCIKLLEITDRKLNNERSKAVLALAKGDLNELSLPYDSARIYLYPDLRNVTTYVLLEQGDWFEKSDMNFFRTILRPDDTVFDIGANVGPYSLSAAARTRGKVIAVEPASKTFELLNRSASQFSNMTAMHAAISDKSGTAFLSNFGPSEKFKLSDNNETQREEVPLITVDDIAAEHGIESVDIIKLGTQGHELKALAGAKKIISNGSPIIFYEIKHGRDLRPELIDAFKDLGYDSYFTLPDPKTLVKYNKDIQIDASLLNMIAIRPESLQRLEGLVNIEQSQADVLRTWQRSGKSRGVDASRENSRLDAGKNGI
jgi:FkbM family methyltransferase